MKKINVILLITFLSILISCQKKESIKIEGDISNPTQKELYIGTQNGLDVDTIKLDDKGHFSSAINKNKGYAIIAYNNQFVPIYLDNGDLKIKASADDFSNSLEYVGGSLKEDNIFLKEHAGDYEKALKNHSVDKIFSMPENRFISFLDSIKSDYFKTLESSKISQSFKENEKKRLFYNFYYWYSVYPDNYKIFSKNEGYLPSEKFEKIKGNISYDNNEDYTTFPNYRAQVREHYLNLIDSTRGNEKELNNLLKEIKDSPIKSLALDIAYHFIPNVTDSQEKVAQKEKSIHYLTNDKKLNSLLENKIKELNKLSMGSVSPNFSYQDLNNKQMSLSDFKGKLVYIDIWATWCGPCKAELPELKKLENAYKGKEIEFVSISIDDKKDTWLKFVKENQLEGIQLFADKNAEQDFIKEYKVNSIPRFILIDKKGNIISSNAPRPSNKEVYNLIDEWLKK